MQLTDDQWTTLKAIAPLLAVSAALLSALVAAITASLVARYNSRKAAELARVNAVRTDRIASMNSFRERLVALEDAVSKVGGIASWTRHELTKRTSNLVEAAQVLGSSSFYDFTKRLDGEILAEAGFNDERRELGVAIAMLVNQMQYLFLALAPGSQQSVRPLIDSIDEERLRISIQLADFRKKLDTKAFSGT